ncbi:MAG: glycosyl hydrolase [Saprospiraceae bacterium]|nr:glycosyl hydrolase [Saprospiraceae bacterium]MBP7679702.1 glycosyl hydrolase [Saprospiraceae bacterium]
MLKFCYTFTILSCLVTLLTAQTSTPANLRLQTTAQRQQLLSNSLSQKLTATSIGPTIFSCRVTDVDVNPSNPAQFYVAYASGGLWKTDNNGNSFSPLFDHEATMTIGDIAVNWQKNIIWIGSGENNSSRSSYAGTGMYKSTDSGSTWQHVGLAETHHIGRVVLHPTNPDVVWVAALGHLYSPNAERGIFRTTDGGKTWQQTLFVNENTGGIDLVVDKSNPNILYAAMWERERRAWNFSGNGKNSGIYKSTDGGATWILLTTAESGFPTGDGVGRIGLDITQLNDKNILYAVLDNQHIRPKKADKNKNESYTKDDFRNITKEDFLKLDTDKLEQYLRANDFPEKYKAADVITLVKNDKLQPIALVEYLEDANAALFDTDIIGAEVYRSDDGGTTWRRTHKDFLDDVFYTYGYYFAQIRVTPDNPNKVYIMGVPIITSDDGGVTWHGINADNVHVDHHALWINPSLKGHIINGNDGGINISYDDGQTWFKCNTPAVGQFYTVNTDMAESYNVYGGAQDNGVWMGNHNYTNKGYAWHGTGQYPYKFIMGGDGMQVAVDTRTNKTVYTGFQFGNYFRINTENNEETYITPKHDLGERPFRWNWQSPIVLSAHNQDVLYMGANKLFRSMDKGKTFTAISHDLTTGGKKGNVPYGTLTTVHESPLRFGLIYVGSDDGFIHVTQDGGYRWDKISESLPQNLWVSRVQASTHDTATVYASLNGYRWDDFTAYLYVSNNFGKTWTRIGTDLPAEPINVVKEDPANPNLLYVGTDHQLYVSLDKGKTFMQFSKDLPAVAVHDVAVQPRDNDLVIGTHGRSMYVASVKHLQALTDDVLNKKLYVFDIDKKRYNESWGKKHTSWYSDEKRPTIKIPFYTNQVIPVVISIKTENDILLKQFTHTPQKGINYAEYDLTIDDKSVKRYEQLLNDKSKEKKKNIELKKADDGNYYISVGTYKLVLQQGDAKAEQSWEVTSK